MKAFLIFLFAGILAITVAVDPQKCSSIQSSLAYHDMNSSLLAMTFNISVYNSTQKGFYSVNITNIQIDTPDMNANKFSPLFASTNGLDYINCTYTAERACYFMIKNSSFFLYSTAQIGALTTYPTLMSLVIDELSISLASGMMFSMTKMNSCTSDFLYSIDPDYPNLNFNRTICCSQFTPIKIPSNPKPPKCRALQTQYTVYNMDDNYSIYFDAKFLYNLTMLQYIPVNGTYNGPDGLCIIGMNNYWNLGSFSNMTSMQYFPIKTYEDNKALLYPFVQFKSNHTLTRYEMSAGKFILRNGYTYMEEEKLYTPENNCVYFSQQFDQQKIGATSTCCTMFE